MQIATGANYEITMEAGTASCRVWKRPELSLEEGARCALEMAVEFQKLARSRRASAMILDIGRAPPITGPKTQSAIGTMLGTFEAARKPIAVVVGDAATQRLQMQRLVQEHARTHGKVFTAITDAFRWIAGEPSTLAAKPPRP